LSRKPVGWFKAFLRAIPAIENGWQGKPASKISWSGMPFASIFVMSPATPLEGKFAVYVFWAEESISLVKTHTPPLIAQTPS
jgi:hypothetical protein